MPQARRPGALGGEAQQARASRPHRGLPAGAGTADRAPDVASHRLKHRLNRYPVPEWVPVPSEASGTPTGVSASLPQGADAAESRLGRGLSGQTKTLPVFHNNTSLPMGRKGSKPAQTVQSNWSEPEPMDTTL